MEITKTINCNFTTYTIHDDNVTYYRGAISKQIELIDKMLKTPTPDITLLANSDIELIVVYLYLTNKYINVFQYINDIDLFVFDYGDVCDKWIIEYYMYFYDHHDTIFIYSEY